MRHDSRDRIAELIGADSELVMFGFKVSRHFSRVCELILVRRFFARRPIGFESDAERFDAFTIGDLAHHREHRAGIESTT